MCLCWAGTGSRRSTYFDGLVSDFKRRQQEVEDGGVSVGESSSSSGRSDDIDAADQDGTTANYLAAGIVPEEKTKLGSDSDKGSNKDKDKSSQQVVEVRTHCKYPWDDTEGAPTQEAVSRAKLCVRRGRTEQNDSYILRLDYLHPSYMPRSDPVPNTCSY